MRSHGPGSQGVRDSATRKWERETLYIRYIQWHNSLPGEGQVICTLPKKGKGARKWLKHEHRDSIQKKGCPSPKSEKTLDSETHTELGRRCP